MAVHDKTGIAATVLACGAEIDARVGRGFSALHVSSELKHPEVTCVLLETGADLNIINMHMTPPLYFAAKSGGAQIVEMLLRHGADACRVDRDLFTPLHGAVKGEDPRILEMILESGGDPAAADDHFQFPLMVEADDGRADLVKVLPDHGANPNQEMADNARFTSLHVAAQGGHVEVMQTLVRAGGDIHWKTASGYAPLHSCTQRGYVKAMLLLLDACAGLEETIAIGSTGVHLPEQNGHASALPPARPVPRSESQFGGPIWYTPRCTSLARRGTRAKSKCCSTRGLRSTLSLSTERPHWPWLCSLRGLMLEAGGNPKKRNHTGHRLEDQICSVAKERGFRHGYWNKLVVAYALKRYKAYRQRAWLWRVALTRDGGCGVTGAGSGADLAVVTLPTREDRKPCR